MNPAAVQEPSPWEGRTAVAGLVSGEGTVTLVEGQSFALSGRTGDIDPDFPQGVFELDTRIVSRWQLRVNGHRLEPLAVATPAPFSGLFVGRTHPPAGHADASVIATRHRDVGHGMRERIVLTNHGLDPCRVEVDLAVDADFADLFAVKENRVRRHGSLLRRIEPDLVRIAHRSPRGERTVTITFSEPAEVDPSGCRWERVLAARESWELCVQVEIDFGSGPVPPLFRCGSDTDRRPVPVRRLEDWSSRLPRLRTDGGAFDRTLRRSVTDLGALRIFDPDHPDRPVIAAGAPWFMTVFGRDSLITGWMTLMVDPGLARGVLGTLASFQGRRVDDRTEEEPGKILHEMRFAASTGLSLGGGDIYYGSIDATPLFVVLADELHRWTGDDTVLDDLLPAVDAAMAWIEEFGDRDGDGYVEYERRSDHGLANQGWKDSWDAVRFADGRLARPPIALCEVQGYVYAAHRARARLARVTGDRLVAAHHEERAADLRRRFEEDFWLDDVGAYALGLDAAKRPIDAIASNMGHLLWAGIVGPDRATSVARHLVGDRLFSGWGVRTLSSAMAAYNPVSYHNGSVWPHDNALAVAGLLRYGLVDEAHRIIRAQLDVAVAHQGRLPELFAGFDRREVPVPAAYPTSCSPQAWAAGSPLLWLRGLLGVEPDAAASTLKLAPALPDWLSEIVVEDMRVGARTLTIRAGADGSVEVDGAGDLEVEVSAAGRS